MPRSTAAAKLLPHCLARHAPDFRGCRPAWVTLPVTQEQLLASVADPSEMRFTPAALDGCWARAHCRRRGVVGGGGSVAGAAAAAATAGGFDLPDCDPGWEGRTPIPVLPVAAVPGFRRLADWVHDQVFLPLLGGEE
jgi:hypothetical protein